MTAKPAGPSDVATDDPKSSKARRVGADRARLHKLAMQMQQPLAVPDQSQAERAANETRADEVSDL